MTHTIVVSDTDTVFTAYFAGIPPSQVTITTDPPGLDFFVDGMSYAGPQVFTWLVGSSHSVSTVTPQTRADTLYEFSHWSDGGGMFHSIVVPSVDTTFAAHFTVASPATGHDRYGPDRSGDLGGRSSVHCSLDTRLVGGLDSFHRCELLASHRRHGIHFLELERWWSDGTRPRGTWSRHDICRRLHSGIRLCSDRFHCGRIRRPGRLGCEYTSGDPLMTYLMSPITHWIPITSGNASTTICSR